MGGKEMRERGNNQITKKQPFAKILKKMRREEMQTFQRWKMKAAGVLQIINYLPANYKNNIKQEKGKR